MSITITQTQRIAILEKADWKCQLCNVPHLATGWRNADGMFIPVTPPRCTAIDGGWKSDKPIIKIVLAIAVKGDGTMLALCQRCASRDRVGLGYEEKPIEEPKKRGRSRQQVAPAPVVHPSQLSIF